MINFLQNMFKPQQKLPEMHFKPLALPQTSPQPIVDETLGAYLNQIKSGQLPYAQNAINRLGVDKVTQGIQQGLNYGVPQISEWQNQYNAGAGRSNPINFPQTQEDVALAQQNKFNPVEFMTGGVGVNPVKTRESFFNKFLNGLQDVQTGFQENLKTPFNVDNLRTDESKNALNRIGEGLGSAARFADKPIGRSLLVGGLVGATGGSPLEMMSYGGQAGLINQTAKMRNNLYKEQLSDLGYSSEQIAGLGGYLDNDTYKNLSDGYYKSQYNQYRNRKLDQDSYIKIKKMFDLQLQNGTLSPQEYMYSMKNLNNRLIDDNILKTDTKNVQVSNQTKKADSDVELNSHKADYYDTNAGQMPIRTGILQQNANSNTTRANAYAEHVGKNGSGGNVQGGKGSGRKNPHYGNSLAEYSQIMNSGDTNKINYARQMFMQKYGEDPDRAIKQDDLLLQKYLGK